MQKGNDVIDARDTCKEVVWDLSELFNGIDDPQILKRLEEGMTVAKAFEKKYKNKLSSLSSDALIDAYQSYENIWAPLYKVSQYVNLVYTLDTSNDMASVLLAKVEEQESLIHNCILFFDLEISKLPSEVALKFYDNKDTTAYHYSLKRSIETGKYHLSEKVEQVINLKNLSGVRANKKLYSDLTNSFEYRFTINGEEKLMNGSELRALRQHKDKDVRRSAMKLFYSKYEENQIILTHCYNNILKNHATEKNLRGYPSAISIKNISNDLDEVAVKALHDVTTASNPLVQRYYGLKAQLLGMDQLTLADIYAPMPESDVRVTWEEAKDDVLSSFAEFDDTFYHLAKRMFDNHRIDAPVGPKKRGGAFCSSSVPGLDPYVMLNFLGRQRDVSTLAHELGHAIHAMLSSERTLLSYHSILPLAETASVFCEMLLTDYLLKQDLDVSARQSLLTDKLEDIFATSHRQNMFSKFEINTHKAAESNLMTSESLCALYKESLQSMFGSSVIQPDEYAWEWSSIPHIFESPFYVYAYNFGNLLVIALYQQYLETGASFIPKLKKMLSLGSVVSPLEITQVLGVDITTESFWQKSISYISGLIDQLEETMKP